MTAKTEESFFASTTRFLRFKALVPLGKGYAHKFTTGYVCAMKKIAIIPTESHPSQIDPSGTIPYVQPPVWVEGIVSPTAQYVNFVKPRVHWFTFAVWKTEGDLKVQTSKLLVFRRIEDEQLAMNEITARSTLRVHVFLNVEWGRAVLTEGYFLEHPCAELAAVVDKVIPPERIMADEFGELLWQDAECFDGQVNWLDKPITIHLNYDEKSKNIQPHLDAARQLWANQMDWNEQMKAIAADKLLKLKNKHWLEPNESPLTPQQFTDQMEMREITIERTGRFEAWFSAESLFGGHAIVVSGHAKKGVKGASMG
jgi:hypothetical protein